MSGEPEYRAVGYLEAFTGGAREIIPNDYDLEGRELAIPKQFGTNMILPTFVRVHSPSKAPTWPSQQKALEKLAGSIASHFGDFLVEVKLTPIQREQVKEA